MSASTVSPPTLAEVRGAAELLAPVLGPAPLLRWRGSGAPPETWLKVELFQPGGSFKVRGVHHAVARMDAARRAAGLATVSAGNTAKALAWSARRFGVPARSLMPEHAPRAKVEAVRALGAEPVLVPVDEVFAFLRERRWEREPYAFVHPWIDRDVVIGHGTLALELLAELPEPAAVYVPVGGGGLMAGVGSVLRAAAPETRIVAVEPEGCPALYEARRRGRPVVVDCRTLCDGVAVPYVTDEMFPLLERLVDDVVLVPEDEVRRAVADLARGARLVVEGSGALALAAARRAPPDGRGPTVCLVTGGSIDPETLAGILEAEGDDRRARGAGRTGA